MRKLLTILCCLSSVWAHANSYQAERWTTKNGMRVSFYAAPQVPMVEARIAFRAGSAYDDQHFGMSSLTGRLIGDAANNMDATQIAEQFESAGSVFAQGNDRDMVVFSLRSLSEQASLRPSIDTFSTILGQARFEKKSFLREKQRLLNDIAMSKEQPGQLANELFYQRLYRNHPYAHPIQGTKDTVAKLSQKQVQQFYAKHYTANNAVMVLVGDLSLPQAKTIAEHIAKQLPSGEAIEPVRPAEPLKKPEVVEHSFPSSQTVLRMGQIGVDYQVKNFFPLKVGNYILGGGALVSRLATEVREKRGLTYGVRSQFERMSAQGPFVIGLSTKTSQTQEALGVTQKVLQQFLDKGPRVDELQAAKRYLTGSFPLGLASNAQIADTLLRIRFYDLPKTYLADYRSNIEKVGKNDVMQAMRDHVHPQKMLLVKVGQM